MRIDLKTKYPNDFVDYLSMISMLVELNESFEVHCDNSNKHYSNLLRLLTLLDVPQERISVFLEQAHTGNFTASKDLNLFCNYYHPEYINVNGCKIKVENTNTKTVVGLACYDGADFFLDNNYDLIRNGTNEGNKGKTSPQCKYRSLDFYSDLAKQIRTFDFNTVTLDGYENLESKIQFIVENCYAVIAFDGVIAQLCHMLKVPCLVLPWRTPNVDSVYGPFQVDYNNRARTAHLIRNDQELNNMSKKDFIELVDSLRYAGRTNNPLVHGDVRMQFNKGPTGKVDFIDRESKQLYRSSLGPHFSPTTKEFIETFYKEKFAHI